MLFCVRVSCSCMSFSIVSTLKEVVFRVCTVPLCIAALLLPKSWGFGCCCRKVNWLVRCRVGWFPGSPWDLLMPRTKSIPLKLYSIYIWYRGLIRAVGVIVRHAMYFTNEVRKTRANILGSQTFWIFFHVSWYSSFLL